MERVMAHDTYQHRDMCIGFWAAVYNRGMVTFPPNARVLEIGCAEADWVTEMKRLRPDLHITAVDWREVERPAADVLIAGDINAQTFAPESFDAIVSVSAVEHIGLHSYGDPALSDGDTQCLQRCASWLKPTGWLYLDVPYRPDGDARGYHVTRNYRGYDEAALQSRLIVPGLKEHARVVFKAGHSDGPYVALILVRA